MANKAQMEAVLTLQDKMTPGLKRAESSFGKFGAKIGSVAKATALAILAVSTAVGVMAFKSGGDLEKTRIAFETMLGSGIEAGKLLKELTDFAKRTPFDLPGVQTAAKQLIAVGAATKDDVLPMLKSIGDVSAGTNAPLERMILNFGQVATQGKLTGRELRDFNVLGVPLMKELADMYDTSTEAITTMVSAGEIGFDDIKTAFRNMSSAGGKFEDLMDKQSNTLPGKIENIKDSFGILTRAIIGIDPQGVIEEGGLFDRFSGILSNVLGGLEELTELFTTNRDKLNDMVQEFDNSTGIITWVKELWSRFKDVLIELWKEVIVPLMPVFEALGAIILLTIVGVLELAVKSLEIFMDNVMKMKNAWADVVDFFTVSASGLSEAIVGATTPVGVMRGEVKKFERVTYQATEAIAGSSSALDEQSDALKEAEKELEKYSDKLDDLTSDTLTSLFSAQENLNKSLLDTDAKYNKDKIGLVQEGNDEIAQVIVDAQNDLVEADKNYNEAETEEDKKKYSDQIGGLLSFLAKHKDTQIQFGDEIQAIKDFQALDEIEQIKSLNAEKLLLADEEHKTEMTRIEDDFEEMKELTLSKWQELYEELRDSGATQLMGDLFGMAQSLGTTINTQQATLVGPGGDKRTVTSGSNEAQTLFGLGYKLLAKGGNLNSGEPAIVGEEGPEMFIPKTAGTVVPNDQMGGKTINVDLRGAVVRDEQDLDSIINAVKQSLDRNLSVQQMGI